MIIWINGSFGVGKTTTAEKLKEKLDNSIIYDPENVGMFLLNTYPRKENDFQDYELWRMINYEILKKLDKEFKIIIVPMTITNMQYYDEIIGRLENEGINIKHFILIASKKNIIKRLNDRGNSTEWSYMQVDRCINAFDDDCFKGTRIDTNNKNANEICNSLIKLL